MTHAAIYTRVSTEDQAREGYSLADQERRGREVAEREGWDVTVYREPARSGADRDRPELARLLRDLEAGEIDVVWFDSQDRLARDVGHTADLFAAFIVADVTLWERYQKLDLGEDGQAQVDLKALFAAWERRKIKARTRKGIAARSATGKHWGAPPFGYRKDADGNLEPDPEQEPLVRRVFAAYLAHGSYNGAGAALTREGIPAPRGGGMWGSSSVRGIIGRRHPVISEDTWQTAQAIAAQTKRYTPTSAGRLPANHLFVRGTLRCAHCKAAMLPRTERKRGKVHETYQCRTAKTQGRDACPMPSWSRADVEMSVLRMFEKEVLSYEKTREHVATQLDSRATEAATGAACVAREALDLRGQADRVERDYRRGALAAEDYGRLRADIADELTAAEAEAARLGAHAEALAAQRGNLDAEDETLARLTALRAAIAGHVTDAGADVGALRAALMTVFTEFWLGPNPAYEENTYSIVPFVRPGWQPVPVPFVLDEKNQHGTLLWKYMTQNTFRLS